MRGSPGNDSPHSMSPRLGLSLVRETSDGSSFGSSPTLRRRGSIVAAKSFKSDGKDVSGEQQSIHTNTVFGKFRKAVHFLVNYHYLSNFMGVVVVFDSYFTGFDIDSRALGNPTPQAILTCSDICLALYTIEMCLILFVGGISVLKDWMLILDSFIILCGYTEILFNYMDMASEVASRITILRVLRMARIVRLMQLLRKSRSLKELQKLVTMMATCMKALAWSFLFCFVIMTVWAMLMVELVHPVIQEIQQEKGVFDGCEQCLRSCQSVMDANLLLFKTVIAGDSWGTIAVPVIEAYPGTAVIFVGSLLSLVFGVLNLIVAVVVDTFAEVRESDVMNLAEEMEHVETMDKKFLQKIFDRIDVQKKGLLTLDDIMAGARTDAEFQSRLRVMDIDEVDLQQLFEMIDVDGSGAIESEEFIVPLSRWVHDSKTAPRFIKYNLMHVMHQQEDLIQNLDRHFVVLNARMSDLEDKLEHMDPKDRGHITSSDGTGDPDLHAEPVQPPRLSKKLGRLKIDAVDAVKPAVAALNESLTDALKLSVAKMEAILQEELSKCYPEPPGPSPAEDVKAAAPQEVAMSIQLESEPQLDSPRDKASRFRLSQRMQSV
eukprot:s2715_g10.t1